MRLSILCLTAAIALLGCSKAQPDATSKAKNSPAPSPVTAASTRAPTPTEWRDALLATYEESQVKDQGDGVIKFMANFRNFQPDVSPLAFGTRDGFRKLRIFHTGMPITVVNCVKVYVSTPDNEQAILFLQPYFWGRNGWLFLNKISVMVDGEVVFERELKKVNRETEGVGVAEESSIALQKSEIDSLRSIKKSSKVIVRLSGEKGYLNLASENKKKEINATKEFADDIQSGIAIFDSINTAIKMHVRPKA